MFRNVKPPSLGPKRLSAALTLAFLCQAAPARADLVPPYSDAITLETFVTGINAATDIAWATDGRAVVTRKIGEITIVDTDGTKTNVTGTFDNVDSSSEKGLNGIFADPSAPNAFFFYVDNGPSTTDKHRVYHGVLSSSENTLTVDADNPIVAANKNPGDPGLEGPANHDGGGLFVYKNQLYIGVGDTGQNASPPKNKYSSCLNKGNGKILRVNLDGTIPNDNPLVSVDSVTSCDQPTGAWSEAAPDKRIFAWGFRNPWRFWIDPHTGLLWIGDVGETTREEISVGAGNQHYGYPFNEGTITWPDKDEGPPDGTLDRKSCNSGFIPAKSCTPPVHDYGRTGGANCVIGGLIPEGCGWSEAFGGKAHYLFADHGANWLHALEVKDDRSGVTSPTALELGTFPSGSGVASIRQGPDGNVYVVGNGSGEIYRLQPKQASGPDCMSMGGMGGGGVGGEAGSSVGPEAGTGQSTAGASLGGGGAVGGRSSNGGGGVSSGGAGRALGGGNAGGASNAGQGAATPSAGATSASRTASKDASKDSGGCGCRTAGRGNTELGALASVLAVAAVMTRRRRRR